MFIHLVCSCYIPVCVASTIPSPSFSHNTHPHSLGVVFRSVTDSADVGQQQPEQQQLVKDVFSPSNEQERPLAVDNEQESLLAGGNPGDYEIALQLHEEERRRQEELDSRMAEQIQLREHTFLAPTSLELGGQQPLPVLNSIKGGELPQLKPVSKSMGKKMTKQKVVFEERDFTPTKSPVVARPQKQEIPKSVKSNAFATEVTSPKKVSNPQPRKVASISTNTKTRVAAKPEAPTHEKTSKSHQLPSNPPPMKVAAIPARKKGAPLKKKVVKPVNPPPPPPPPPPLPPSPPPPSLRIVSNKSSTHKTPRRSAHSTSKFLQPVETVVKRAFRVGERVGHLCNNYFEIYSTTRCSLQVVPLDYTALYTHLVKTSIVG